MNKDMEKRLPQLYYVKIKISFDLGFIANFMQIYFFLLNVHVHMKLGNNASE